MPAALNHIAVSVSDITQAMEWYRDVLGMQVLGEPAELSAGADSDPHLASVLSTIFGRKSLRFIVCHLLSGEGVGIELFEFIEPKAEKRQDNFDYWKTGFFHIAVTEPQVEKLADRIAASGGKKRTGPMELVAGSGRLICFCEDPFGNVIEIYSHSYREFWAGPAGK